MGGDQEDHALGTQGPQIPLDLEFRELGPATAGDLFQFFAGPAFADFPEWRSCNCFFYNFAGDGEAWKLRTAEQNRVDKQALVDGGRTHGVLAYHQGEVAGWCHADLRANLVAYDRWARHPTAGSTGVVTCFVVDPRHRRQGVARRLLDEACSMLRRLDLEAVEAYPPAESFEGLPADQGIYRGPAAMYEAAGFERVGADSPVVIMRKPLR